MMKISSILTGLVAFSLLFKQSTGQTYTYCYNETSCFNETITTTYAYCWGYLSCQQSAIDSTYAQSYGMLATYDANVTSTYLYSQGYFAAYDAILSVYIGYIYGYFGAAYAEFTSIDTVLNLYLYGYYAGYYSDIYCYDGDTCSIYCGNSYGCSNSKFYCYSGATCYYDCESDETCPTLYSGVSSYVLNEGAIVTSKEYKDLTDQEIDIFKNENKELKLNQIKTQKKTGKLDKDVYDSIIKLATERGELGQIPKDLLEGNIILPKLNNNNNNEMVSSVSVSDDSIINSIENSGYSEVIYTGLGITATIMVLISFHKVSEMKNSKEMNAYQAI